MKRNVSIVRFKFGCNILISGKIIKEMPGSVASGTHCIFHDATTILAIANNCLTAGGCKQRAHKFTLMMVYGTSNLVGETE